MIKFLRNLPAIAALLLAIPALAVPAGENDPSRLIDGDTQPAVWLLEDDDTRIWLFGTNHILPADYRWRSAELDAIIADADELVLEVADDSEAYLKPERFLRLMTADQPSPILQRISPEYRNNLRAIIKYSELTIDVLDTLETWAVAFVLMSMSYEQYYGVPGVDGSIDVTGVEEILTERFEAQDKPVSGVETTMGQLNFFRNLSEDGQRRFLEGMVAGGPEDDVSDEDAILANWRIGNVAALDGECDDPENFPEEVHNVLLTMRNANWTDWLIERLDEPGDVLFAVGACHLAGRERVQAMLEQRGFTARRVH